jgi:hypothetical protein
VKKRIEHVFKTHPKAKEVHTTSDELIFLNDHDAHNHAKTLKNTDVKTVKKGDKIEEDEPEKGGGKYPEGEPKEGWKSDELKAYMDEKEIAFKGDETKKELVALIVEAQKPKED